MSSVLLFSDINECVSQICNRGQICVNTVGSYTCQRNSVNCGRGYHLNEEGTRCVGTEELIIPTCKVSYWPTCGGYHGVLCRLHPCLQISMSVRLLKTSVEVMRASTCWGLTDVSVKLATCSIASLGFVKVNCFSFSFALRSYVGS